MPDTDDASSPADDAADVLGAVFSFAVDGGMDPDFAEFHVTRDPETGDATVTSVSEGGEKFDGMVSGADIADALGLEPAAESDASESPAAPAEKAVG